MKLKLGVIVVVLFAVGILVSPTFSQEQPAQQQSQNTLSDKSVSDSAALTTGGTPHIFFPDTIFNFGEVPQKQSVTHVFKVRNTGDGVLKLLEAHAP